MKDIILKYITEQFSESNGDRYKHFSYCKFPEEDCCCRVLDDTIFTYDTDLITDGYIDSFSTLFLVVFLEKTFNIKIPDIMINQNNFNTINRIVELVKNIKNNNKK